MLRTSMLGMVAVLLFTRPALAEEPPEPEQTLEEKASILASNAGIAAPVASIAYYSSSECPARGGPGRL